MTNLLKAVWMVASATGEAYPRLFSPLTIGSRTLANRVVMLPMGLKGAAAGELTADDMEFYRARLHTGIGMLVTGGTIVHPSCAPASRVFVEAYSERNEPHFRRLAAMAHEFGSAIVGQILHLGNEDFGPTSGPRWTVSAPADGATADHVMTIDDIAELVESFATCARRMVDCGYDGVEIQGAHGYLIDQFLASESNRRDDEFGGSWANRERLLVDIIAATRAAIGDRLLGVRLSLDDEVTGGLAQQDVVGICTRLEGFVDYVSLATGRRGSYVKDGSNPRGFLGAAGASLRTAISMPALLSQRITTPDVAEQLLVQGSCDLVGLARAFLADPDWLAKARDGRPERIRRCISCVQGCRPAHGRVGCTTNPVTGYERIFANYAISARRPGRRVAVVGGGPAGLEAARVAAERGHTVTLFERDDQLGGQVNLSKQMPSREETAGLIDFRIDAIGGSDVDVRLSTEASSESLDGFDAAIVATGAAALASPALGGWWSLSDVLARHQELAAARRSVIVADEGGGGWDCWGVAETLAADGHDVTVVTNAVSLADGVPADSVFDLRRRLKRLRVRVHFGARVTRAGQESVHVTASAGCPWRDEQVLPYDLGISLGRREPRSTGWPGEGSGALQLIFIGDCVAPRGFTEAIAEGFRAGVAL